MLLDHSRFSEGPHLPGWHVVRIVEAYLRGDEDVRIEGDTVVASIEGFMEPVRIPLSAIERAANSRGHGGFRKLATPSAEEVDKAAGHVRPVSGTGRSLGNKVLGMEQTVVTSLYTVRPQHCNSKSVSWDAGPVC